MKGKQELAKLEQRIEGKTGQENISISGFGKIATKAEKTKPGSPQLKGVNGLE